MSGLHSCCQQTEQKIGKKPDEAYLYWITEPPGVDPIDPVDTDPALLSLTKKRIDKIAQKILIKDLPSPKKGMKMFAVYATLMIGTDRRHYGRKIWEELENTVLIS